MTNVDAAALEKVLTSIEVRVGGAQRVALDAGGMTPLTSGAVWLVFVSEGSVIRESSDAGRRELVEGDAFLTLGRRSLTLRTENGASLMLAQLQLSATANSLSSVLPESMTVTDFAALEPAAAAHARNLGRAGSRPSALRSGDPVICRMMATTVLLSVIRAWAENGCAPTGWPSRSNDPYLDRVIDAIHRHPGRGWTVEALASVGAMSRSAFAERFHTALGRSPASYVTEVRMRQAKQMLDAGRSVSETSRELGYSSDEGFSRAFRRHTGVTPSMWRASRRSAIPA